MESAPKYPKSARIFAELLAALDLSASRLAREISTPGAAYSQQVLSNYVAGKSKPPEKVLAALARRYPALDPRWLLTGEGVPFPAGRYRELSPAAPEPPTPPAGPAAIQAAIQAPPADTVAQFLALLAEREAALNKDHRATLQLRAKDHQYTVARMQNSIVALEAELHYLRGLLGHRPPTADELALQQQQAAAAKGKPAGFKNYDEQPAPQAVEMTLSRGETAFPRPPEPVAAAPCPLRCAA